MNQKGAAYVPLTVNVGLSRKVGEANYGSRGASLNVELELDGGLLGEPAKLQERIRHIFALVRTSLTEELQGAQGSKSHDPNPPPPNGQATSTDRQAASGKDAASEQGSGRRPATAAQVKALYAITWQREMDLRELPREQFRVERPEDLSLRQASRLIDQLKSARTRGAA
jgi:hypothetical protein